MSLLEVLVHQSLVILCRSLYEGVVKLFGSFHLFRRNLRDCRSASVGSPFVFLHQEYVNHRVEPRTRLQRILNLYYLWAESLTH